MKEKEEGKIQVEMVRYVVSWGQNQLKIWEGTELEELCTRVQGDLVRESVKGVGGVLETGQSVERTREGRD